MRWGFLRRLRSYVYVRRPPGKLRERKLCTAVSGLIRKESVWREQVNEMESGVGPDPQRASLSRPPFVPPCLTHTTGVPFL